METTAEKEQAFARALMQKLPAVVRVGPYDFRIVQWTIQQATGISRWGEFSSIEQTIRLQTDMPSRYKCLDTFFHELCHAIYWAYGISDDDKEERIVGMLGSAMAALYRDNPWLAGWVQSAKL